MSSPVSPRLAALLVWALVAASGVAWGLHLFARGPSAPANTVTVGEGGVAGGDLTRLLGTPPVAAPVVEQAPAAASRFQLTGVVAARPPATQGIALIAVDGKIPRAFAVGATVADDLTLRSVDRRSVSIAAGAGAPVVLEMPPLPVAATGMLMPAVNAPGVNSFPPSQQGGRFTPPAQGRPQFAPPQQPQVQMGVQPGMQSQDEQPEPPHGAQPNRGNQQ